MRNTKKRVLMYKKYINYIVIILNALLLAGAFWCYKQYTRAYQEKLWDENLGNVSTLNDAAIINSTSLFENWNIKLLDIKHYVEGNELTLDETLDYITDCNSQEDRYFQLINKEHLGYLAQKDDESGDYIPLDYSSYSYQTVLHPVLDGSVKTTDGIRFTPEFTDAGTTGVKFFAVYQYITISGQEEPWTLLLAMRSKTVMEKLNSQTNYDGQSSVIINSKGNFVVNNKYFSSTNLYDYIRERNNLSLEQRKELAATVQSTESGELFYKKLSGAALEDTAFCYEKMTGLEASDWYCVTCVPVSSFERPTFNSGYIFGIFIALIMMILIDIFWLNALNRKLRESMIREKNASRAKGNFLSRMSHEIRTPLNAVIGYNTIARNYLVAAQTDAEHKRAGITALGCLEKSNIASKHLLTIINEVLDVSAIESEKISIIHEKFNFRSLITSLTTVFYSQAHTKGINFEVIFQSLTQEWFVGDQMRTNQILTNLLSNAVKFTSSGGNVTLTISQSDADDNDAHIHFIVSDTGIGMTEEYLGHIWDPFEQADSSISRRFGGTGLGMTITKNLVDLMGGSITASSTPGEGTTFEVDLTFEAIETEQPEKLYDFNDVNAMVIGDETTCNYIMILFNRCGVSCTTVDSSEAALEVFQRALEEDKSFTLCLVDLKMLQANGLEAIRLILDIAGDKKPAIVLTAYDNTEIPEQVLQLKIDHFLSKPLFQSALFDMLADISGMQVPQKAKQQHKPHFDGEHVLLAEDNPMNMEIAYRLLESVGLVIERAWNGREAVEYFTNSEPGTFRAILMDIHMPELDGLSASQMIRSSTHPEAKTVPIIAMTADAFAENIAEAMNAGMNDQVSKPIDLPTLFATLEKYIKN